MDDKRKTLLYNIIAKNANIRATRKVTKTQISSKIIILTVDMEYFCIMLFGAYSWTSQTFSIYFCLVLATNPQVMYLGNVVACLSPNVTVLSRIDSVLVSGAQVEVSKLGTTYT